MLIHERSWRRPFHFGPFPLETLPRDETVIAAEAARASIPDRPPDEDGVLAMVARDYTDTLMRFAKGDPAPRRAPLPDDLSRRAADIKGAAYFLDASGAGICNLPASAWLDGASPIPGHDHAAVFILEHIRCGEPGEAAHDWLSGARRTATRLRLAEIAISIAGHIRNLGYTATAHIAGDGKVDLDRLAVLAGLAVRHGEEIANPFLGTDFGIAAITTDYPLAIDAPLAATAMNAGKGLRYWWGINGAMSGRERNRRNRRALHMSRYPMEQVKRVDRPTTLILDDEVPRVPKRAAFFQRALHGDLGDKAKRERARFAFKTPLSLAMLQAIRALVPKQDGPLASTPSQGLDDAAANTRSLKAMAHALGADLAGICEVPRYAWFSHKEDGSEIAPYHRYAVVMLIDQGYETMEGASGDDWMSGAQSMRSYLRGAEIAGVMAEFLRRKGVSARPQTNADSDVLHIPLVLWAGLGELSRIGELVLNPFVGPRFKSVVMTTDLPLIADRPVDFGLQEFCQNCLKCARECPCDAISFGDKVMFNGYAMWKPDVERCTRYRLTNMRGSACGRCMKTCPINKVVDADGAWLTRIGSWLGVHARALKPLTTPFAVWFDDFAGHGRRNPAKRWWFDHEMVNGVAVEPRVTNERDIDPGRRIDKAAHKIAYYPASAMPPPDRPDAVPLDRKQALAMAAEMETPAAAAQRHANGEPAPTHGAPAPPSGRAADAGSAAPSPFR